MHDINISPDAYAYLARKGAFYGSRKRFPRVILTELSCSGAKFDIHFDFAREDDVRLRFEDIEVLADPGIIERFGGFTLELESFFFASRVLVKPRLESFECGCKKKCNTHKEET
ncbi:MAG: hypothetical protein U1B83_07650 [Candidatus Cloacimonadaceae bacterium]|nr:hypothetical protein [Actinomycetota bacterium]MDZ4182733.1 hypothetical protein [Candidatus Cloacimonadaceae bacterium]